MDGLNHINCQTLVRTDTQTDGQADSSIQPETLINFVSQKYKVIGHNALGECNTIPSANTMHLK